LNAFNKPKPKRSRRNHPYSLSLPQQMARLSWACMAG